MYKRQKYNRVFGYYLEVTNSFKNMVPDYYVRKQTLTNAERYTTCLLYPSFSADRIDTEYWKKYNEEVYDKLDVPLGISLGSVLGDIRNMVSVIGMSYLMYDEDEDLFADIIDTYAEMQYRCVEAVLEAGAWFDFGHFWEDICFNSGPLLSPAVFEELCARHYKRRCDLLRKYGIDLISLDCDGVTEKLQQTWLDLSLIHI